MKNHNKQPKILSLINEIQHGIEDQPANKLISKIYDLVKNLYLSVQANTLHQEIIISYDQQSSTNHQIIAKEKLSQYLKSLSSSYSHLQNNRTQEIKKFNQVEYYMFQQTNQILKQHSSFPNQKNIQNSQNSNDQSIIKTLVKKISSLLPTSLLEDQNPQNNPNFRNPNNTVKSVSSQSMSSKNSLTVKNLKDCQKIWEKVLEYYESHRLDEAYAQAENFQNGMNYLQKTKEIKGEQKELIQKIRFQYKTMSGFYDHFYDTGYTFDKSQKGISLWYKIIGQKDVAIKVTAQIDISMQNFLCIASQIDLFQQYIPFTYDTKQLKHISRNQKIGTSKIYIPLLTDRQTYFYAAAYDRLRTKGSIFFFSQTINQNLQYQKRYDFKVPEKSDCIRLQYKYYILQYVPITKKRGRINMVSSIDLKMDFLPLFIINKSARIFSFDYMKNYSKINKNFAGSKWDQIKQKKKDFYDYFQKKIQEYIDSNQFQQ